MIKGITFDLWDTILVDDSDEPKRKTAGRSPKPEERRRLVHEMASRYCTVSTAQVNAAYDEVDRAFKKVWHDEHITWTVHERLSKIMEALGTTLSEKDMTELVRRHEEMELEFRPDFIAGTHDILCQLHGQYRLGVISDAIFSPGRILRILLKDEGLLDYFDICVFSDECGHSKPHPDVFKAAWKGLNLNPSEVVHIGDREHNDILGPQQMEMKAILCTAAVDRDSKNTKANAIFKNYKDLPPILDSLNSSKGSKR